MRTRGVFVVVLLITNSFGIKFYEGSKEFEYNCSLNFTEPKLFDCACLTGVWRIFSGENCDSSRTVGGSNFCTKLSDPYVSRVEKITDDLEQLYFRFKNGSVIILSEDTSFGLNDDEIDSWVAATSWTVYTTENTPVCLSVPKSKYCMFSDMDTPTISKITRGCIDSMKKVAPKSCNDIMADAGNVCEGNTTGLQKGRVFFFAPGMKKNVVEAGNGTVNEDDADYFESIGSSRYSISDVRITTMIYNEVQKMLDVILQISDDVTKSGPVIKTKPGVNIPAYTLLELCAEIMKISCPSHYFNPALLEMSVRIFNNLLRNEVYLGEFGMEYNAYMRVTKALEKCKNGTTPFNFTKEYLCSDSKVPHGNYFAYGFAGEVYLTLDDHIDVPFLHRREPIIETVWQIFYNAHSLCFEYFDESYNDHHRFSTLMIPIFQTKVIQKIWYSEYYYNLTKDSTGAIFGNQETMQINLLYCSMSSRLESAYPWDMDRPLPIKTVKGRKRSVRSINGSVVSNIDYQCSSKQDVAYCKTNL